MTEAGHRGGGPLAPAVMMSVPSRAQPRTAENRGNEAPQRV
jgi:hypothetical protein